MTVGMYIPGNRSSSPETELEGCVEHIESNKNKKNEKESGHRLGWTRSNEEQVHSSLSTSLPFTSLPRDSHFYLDGCRGLQVPCSDSSRQVPRTAPEGRGG